ncbi:hypothetical protein [Halobacillus seohaensis]|uniref:Uncharacterized protein n=1 Tax=Halobacillus seohaensis TaxID=447421 RepID=A0ABW2ENV3_9BACI
MEKDRGSMLATYLVGLAILESNGQTYVRQEIREAMSAIKKELEIKK